MPRNTIVTGITTFLVGLGIGMYVPSARVGAHALPISTEGGASAAVAARREALHRLVSDTTSCNEVMREQRALGASSDTTAFATTREHALCLAIAQRLPVIAAHYEHSLRNPIEVLRAADLQRVFLDGRRRRSPVTDAETVNEYADRIIIEVLTSAEHGRP